MKIFYSEDGKNLHQKDLKPLLEAIIKAGLIVSKDDRGKVILRYRKEKALPEAFDARVWAKAFVESAQKDKNLPFDYETMLTWFSNAIMAGYDFYRREERK